MNLLPAAACLITACLALGIWQVLLFARGGFWRVRTDDETPAAPDAWPSVHIIVPARNEAEMLPLTLPGLLCGDYPGALHMVLVDDRSEDGTAQVAASIAARHNAATRLSVITARSLPSGWKGKVWAMQCGLDHIATLPEAPRYVLFTDADIAYDAGTLAALVAQTESVGLALNSRMVRLRCESLAERLLVPAFVYFFRMLYPFSWVGNPRKTMAAAAGGCMLVRYDALRSAGEMAPLRSALIDDCALGRQMKRQGRIRLALTRRIHSLRPYPAFGDIRRMIARSAYDQLGYSPLALTGCLLGMCLTYIAPPALALWAGGEARQLALSAWACMALSFYPMLRFYGRPPLLALALPLIAAAYMGFTLDSAWQYMCGRGGAWKGRMQATGMQGI